MFLLERRVGYLSQPDKRNRFLLSAHGATAHQLLTITSIQKSTVKKVP